MVDGDVFPEFSNPNMIVYDFRTSQLNFIQNKHVKLNETCLDTQGHFKATFSNVMDVWPLNSTKPDTLPISTIVTHLRNLQP